MKILISAKELSDNFHRYKIIDLRSKQEYDTAHIKGAVSLPAGDAPFKAGADIISRADWTALLGRLGVTNDAKIAAYDDGASGRAAARFWYVAKHYGHEDLLILNGGFGAAAGVLPISASPPDITPTIYAPSVTPGFILNLNDLLANYNKAIFLDVRTPEEFLGSNLRGNPRGGHIRGAKPIVTDNFFADAPGQSFANPEKLAQTISNIGVRKEDLIITY
jgi:thiosulfate/3-mercaptopyruvate sulfurtransferase